MKLLALVTVFLFAFLKIGNSLTCLQCDGITHPRHCRYVADCFEGEVCAVEMVNSSFGQHLYKVGCVSPSQCSNSSLQSYKCHECCNTNLCNAQGCGEAGYPTERGPICYHCPAQVDVRTCNTIEFCETGEMCYYMEREEFGDMVYTGRCISKHLCTSSGFLGNVIVGRDLFFKTSKQSRSLKDTRCEGCCGFDLCNKGCNISNQDNCRSSPCLHGQCVDTTKGFNCLCPVGVTGVRCEIDINDCSPNPCQNGGSCTDGVNFFTCSCVAGFTGTTCQTNIIDCYPNPCQNGGTCTDGINSYTCKCAAGYTGTNCSSNINDCSPNPCQNGGSCTDGVNFYTCSCVAGFKGTTCQTTSSFVYLGCYEDCTGRILTEPFISNNSMTTQMCLKICFNMGMRYFLTEHTTQCFCGNSVVVDLANRARTDSECNHVCAGDSTEKCGGFCRGSLYIITGTVAP